MSAAMMKAATMRAAFNVSLAFAVGASVTYVVLAALIRRTQSRLPDDAQLRQWVRSRVSSLTSQPDAIDVTVENGLVRVSGPVPASEQDLLLSRLAQIRGVRKIYNALQPVPGQ
jgi:hypothetical protein